jgi:hypothetical protein
MATKVFTSEIHVGTPTSISNRYVMTTRTEVRIAIRVDMTACGTHRQAAGANTYSAEAAKPRGVKKSTMNTATAIAAGIQLSSRPASGGPNARLSWLR